MDEPIKEGEKKPAEAPAQEPVKIEVTPPQPGKAGTGEKGKETPVSEEDKRVKEVIEANQKALKAAETEIVRLKRELKKKEQGEDTSEDASDIRESIEALKGEIEELKSSFVPREEKDKTLEELAMARKQNEELGRALVSKNTTGRGEGTGNNQDVPKPEEPQVSFAKTPQEIAILERRGIDPKTGKKKSP